ncbi:hypothetical protein MKW98_017752 [Papaver atlanticum]|uniref:Uncharacterized protein n=1 Tax=Papaver atlanticum TaxID=357466 RepID=A0AAD4TEP4_9MAGN|nr:hypothetical protein MKW98_017752 [Papaver atlanticum]
MYNELCVEFKKKKMEFIETEKRFETLIAENNDLQKYRNMYNELNVEFEEKKIECDVIMGKLNDQDLVRMNAQKVLEEYEITCTRLKEQVNSLEDEEKKWEQERTAYMEQFESEQRDNPSNPPGSSPSSLQGNFEDARVSGTPHLDCQCELSEGIKDEKNNICFDSMVDFVIADRQQLGFETNESSRETLVLLKQGDIRTSSTCIIEISDDEVMEICDSEEDNI